jgi:hypothetical protein
MKERKDRLLTFADFDNQLKMDAADLLARHGWKAVCSQYPKIGGPYKAFISYVQAAGGFKDPNLPMTDLEKLGQSLSTSIGKLAYHHFGYHQKPTTVQKSNGTKVKHDDKRSLIYLYEKACNELELIPEDKAVALFASIVNIDHVISTREQLRGRWEFMQQEDGRWKAKKKDEIPDDVRKLFDYFLKTYPGLKNGNGVDK